MKKFMTLVLIGFILNSFMIKPDYVQPCRIKPKKDTTHLVVQKYINKIAPKSDLDAKILLSLCKQYEVDYKFVLAQAQYESHFGTRGLAAKTNSMFSVGAYDGWDENKIHTKYKYPNVNESIEPYLILLKKRYLVDKTEYDLLKNYVDVDGRRYASAKGYEKTLNIIYNTIKRRI